MPGRSESVFTVQEGIAYTKRARGRRRFGAGERGFDAEIFYVVSEISNTARGRRGEEQKGSSKK